MKTKIFLLLLLICGQLTAQILSDNVTTTRAVIIGISDYQNESIPDLRFADKDAQAFAQYLQSNAGGNVPEDNIKLLTNEAATMAAIAGELDWLVEESTEGDQAIIYFSGHGDVEAKTARQPGFLLTYDSPPKIYIAGAYPLFYLQLIIETLSSDKNVQTLVITDACRAGKLAGSEIGGTQATAANLARQYANEIKILSCQPNEFSLEGEQWGGGRGVFSYHLIEGLIGLADKNENNQVNLLELENHLESTVPSEAAPQSQIPMTVGSKGTQVALVDPDILAELKQLKAQQLPTLAAIASRGMEEILLASVDSTIQQKYEDFIAALDNNHLLEHPDEKISADELYRELIQEESLADLHRLMTRQLATALQDEAQQAINAYLLANPTELEKRWKGDTKYAQYPRYLGRAAELLGESHYMYKFLKAKQLYFEGLSLRLQADRSANNDSIYNIAIQKLEMALSLEDRAPFFYNELGVLNTRLKNSKKAVKNFEQAIAYAPEWGLPYVNYSLELFYTGQVETAIEYGEKALEFLPQFPQMYNFLAWMHANDYDWLNKQNWDRQGAELSGNLFFNESSTSSLAQNQNRFKRGIELLEIAKTMDSNHYATFLNLGAAYWQIEEYQKAETELKKAIQIDSTHYMPWFYLGRVYFAQKRTDEGITAMLKQIEVADNDLQRATGYNTLAWGYRQKEDFQAEIEALKTAIELAPNFYYAQSNLSIRYMQFKRYEEAESKLLDLLKTYSSHIPTYEHLGKEYELLNRDEDAEYIYLKGLEQKPDYVKVLNSLQALYQKNGQLEKALDIQQRLIQIEPDNLKQLVKLEVLYSLLGNLKKAEEFSKEVNKNLPKTSIEIINIAYQYLYAKDFNKADYLFKKAEELEPNGKWNDWNRCCYHSIKEEPKKAVHFFAKSLESGYDDFNHIHSDADAANMRTEPQFEILMEKYFPGRVYKGQVASSEDSAPIYFPKNCLLLGEFYESNGESDQATQLYQTATALNRDNFSKLDKIALAQIFLKLDNPKEAKAICPEEVFTDDPEENYQIGILYFNLKKSQKAEQYFKKYLELSTDKLKYQKVTYYFYLQGEELLAEKYLQQCIDKDSTSHQVYLMLGFLKYNAGKYEESQAAFDEGLAKFPNETIIRIAKAATMAYAYPEKDAAIAFKPLEELMPATPKIVNFINLVNSNQFEKAAQVQKEINLEKMHPLAFAFFQYGKLRILVAQNDFDEAMEMIKINHGGFFSFQYLHNDPALAPLRQTEQFKAFINISYPGKSHSDH